MKSTYLNGNATECSVLSHPPVLLNSSRSGPTHDFQIHSNILFKVDKSASTPITAAAIARMVSTVLLNEPLPGRQLWPGARSATQPAPQGRQPEPPEPGRVLLSALREAASAA